MTNDKCEMTNDKCLGYTLLELLTVLTIVGIMVTGTVIAWQRVFGRVTEDIPVAAALRDMKAIQDAIVKGFYPDIQTLPYDEKNPEYANRYLCLNPEHPKEREEMAAFLESQGKLNLIEWNKYYAKGWRGPYIECDSTCNATELDPVSHPPDAEGNPVYLPVIATPWADECEKMALEEIAKGDPNELAAEYRRGKYYQLFTVGCIVCKGQDCLSGNNGDNDMEEYFSNYGSICKADCKDSCLKKCQAMCEKQCKQELGIYWEECMPICVPGCNDECFNDCYFNCINEFANSGLGKNLKIIDPYDPDYVNIGDDIVMFVFVEGLRSPLEK